MPDPPGLVVKNGTNRLPVFPSPGPSSSTHSSTVAGDEPGTRCQPTRTVPPGLVDGVHGVANQVDQQLLELVGVALDGERRAGGDLDVVRLLERRDAIDEPGDVDRRQLRRRQLREPGIGAHEPAQRLGTRGDDVQAALHVVAPVGGRRLAVDDRREAAGDRLDRRQRIVHLVADDADQPLPGLPFFFPQRLAEVGQHQQLVRAAALAELAAPDLPPADAAGKRGVDDARRLAGQAIQQPDLVGIAAEQPLRRLVEQPRAGAC